MKNLSHFNFCAMTLPNLNSTQMKSLVITFSLFWLTSLLQAVGWTDYTLDIGDGYTVFRANRLEVCIGKKDSGVLILVPMDYKSVGPVVGYDMRRDYLLAKNAGRVPRNKFEGDRMQNPDPEQEWYFLIPKATDQPLGPYLKEEFLELLRKKNLKEPEWIRPKNPDTWLPVLGSLLFVVMAIPLLAARYFYISIPLFFLAIWLVVKFFRERKREC